MSEKGTQNTAVLAEREKRAIRKKALTDRIGELDNALAEQNALRMRALAKGRELAKERDSAVEELAGL